MEPNERRVFAGVMAAYERSRLKRAASGAMLTLLFPLIAFVVGGRLVPSLVLGLGLWAVVVALGWRGQAWGLSVPAGLKAGAFPLALSLIAQRIGHVCSPHGCTSLCVPMCTVGGVIAGLIIASHARRSPSPWLTLGGAAAVSIAVGAMGCACVGMAGTLAMGASLFMSAGVWSAIRWAR